MASHQRPKSTGSRKAIFVATLVAAAFVMAACGGVTEQPTSEAEASLIHIATDGEATNAGDLDGSTVAGVIQILVEVKGKKVTEVRFHLDGAATPLEVDTSSPFELVLDTTRLSDGRHLIVAVTPVGNGSSTRELVRAEFTVANGGAGDDPLPSDPDPEPAPVPSPNPGPVDGIRIEVGVDPRVVVRAHPAGSTFVFASGVHRLSGPIVPRDGDVFVGEVGAVLSGAHLLTSFGREGGLWVVSGQTQQGFRHGSCTADAPRCSYPEDLFMDDVPLRHVGSLSEVVAGAWFFDYDNDRIYFADDPTGRVVETSVATAAISGDADDVTVRDLIVEKFANPSRPGGAINTRVMGNGMSTHGERWVIEDNTVRLNHSMGINAGHGARIRNNRVLWNGQLGLGGGGGHGTLIEGNEIAYNNWAGFDWGWEAGGAKWVGSDGLIVRNNHSHHNNGPGLWTDIDNINTLYEHNLVEHNTAVGIFHEVSYEATIRHNTVLHNGIGPGYEQYVYVYGSGILVSSSLT
jgi:hypothetical protein